VEPVIVPAPPRAAYNPNRPISDLITSQIKFFQHIELKRGDLGIDPKIAGNVHTEAGAAEYIAAVAHALRGKTTVATPAPKLKIISRTKSSKKQPAAQPLSIAAAAGETTSSSSKKSSARRAAKRSSTKPTPKRGEGKNKGKQ
jgi:hypothetical protein